MEQENIRKTRILGFVIAIITTLIIGCWAGLLISGKSFSDIIAGIKDNSANSENVSSENNSNDDNNNTQNNNGQTEKTYTQSELEQMALNYYEALTGYRPSMVASIVNEDGTLSIQMYDSLGDHNSTSDWYTVDMKTAEGTNIMEEKIDLKVLPTKKQSNVTDVNYKKINTDDAKYYMIVNGVDNEQKTVWTYTTSTDYIAQVDLLEFLQVKNNVVYINEHAKIVALDMQTGDVIWENSDYEGGGSSYFKFDDNGYLYLTGAMSPDLLVIAPNGKTVKLIRDIDEDLVWPTSLNLDAEYAVIEFPVAGFSGEEDSNFIYLELDDLKNIDNKILSKEIVPEFLHTQINGFEDINKFILESNGDVFIKFEPDSNLMKQYGDIEGLYKVASNVKNIYALSSGNGGYGDLIMVKNDGTVSIISSYELYDMGEININDANQNNIEYVIAIRGFDGYYFAFVDKNGKVTKY